MMREVAAIHYYYDYCNLGGVTSILKQRIALLRKRGLELPFVLHFLRDLGGRHDLEALDGVTVRLCPTDQFRPWCADLIGSEAGALHVLLDQPEVVQLLGAAAPGLLYEVHTSLEQAFRRMRGVDFSAVEKILCPSHWLRSKLQEVLIGYDAERIRICPNFVDPDVFRPMEPGDEPIGDPILLWVGKLNADKNLGDAVEIMRQLSPRIPFQPIFVTGGGSDRAAVANLMWRLEASGLSERARWIANLSNTEMPKLLARTRASRGVLLSTSKFESFGLAALEAMACGVPVVAAKVGGLIEVIRDKVDGFLYPLSSPESAVEIISGLLSDQAGYRRLSAAANGRAAHFAADAAVAVYERELLAMNLNRGFES